MRPRKLTDEEVDGILRWWRLRKTRKQLACLYGVSERTITRIVRDGGYNERESVTEDEFEALRGLG